jgi:hypothetical protein
MRRRLSMPTPKHKYWRRIPVQKDRGESATNEKPKLKTISKPIPFQNSISNLAQTMLG